MSTHTESPIHHIESHVPPPQRFTWPFCYEPHPLCIAAAEVVQKHIEEAAEWREDADRGKMFGVLVVRRNDGTMAFLAAYSGLLGGRNDWPWFVPSVYDSQQPDGYFKRHEAEISDINKQIEDIGTSERLKELRGRLADVQEEAGRTLLIYKEQMAEAKRRRDILRSEGGDNDALTRESQFMKAELRRMKKRFEEAEKAIGDELKPIEEAVERLKQKRKQMSDDLQRWLFSQYIMLNALGGRRSLVDIFDAATGHIPPSGAGDCCAPKLLQYAFLHGLRPLCMAEFWWGASPQSEIRRHLHYYPACHGKCKPILGYMMQGLDVDPDPQSRDAYDGDIEVIYEDSDIIVVCKPSGLLSVPGKNGRPSVLSLMKQRCPDAEGPLIVHRLDMDTSGLMVVAKTMPAYLNLQAQFASRSISKLYVALLQDDITTSHIAQGTISLPLRPDIMDRPRQTVDRNNGKPAVTEYRLTGDDWHGHSRVELHPLTGRTHQLRVHCAHPDGLGCPIHGDPLYGHPSTRLCLHAARITFTHPVTGKRLTFESKPTFTLDTGKTKDENE